jgi:hypothetical protein
VHAIVLVLFVLVACGHDKGAPPPPAKQPPAAAAAPAVSSTPKPRVAFVFTKALTDTTLTDEMLLARVEGTYLPGLKRCYGAELAKTPDAQGKVVLKLAVASDGHTRNIDVAGFGTELPACVKTEVAAWTFAIPTHEGTAVEAPFMMKLLFTPTL